MDFQQQFPILNTCSYLNTASSGIMSRSMLDWRIQHDLDFFNTGGAFRNNQGSFLQEIRENVARFFNAKAEYTYLTPNFSFGFNTFLAGLSSSHRFLLLEEDYPSVNYAVESRGFACDYVTLDTHFEERILERIKIFKPTVFAFSMVQYIGGQKIDLEFIKKVKEEFPDLLIVADGTQYCGTDNFDFEKSGLDVLAASGYKWMLAGYGNGFTLLKPQVAELLYTDAQKRSFPKEPFLKDKGILSMCFEPGHQDTLAFGSLNHSVLCLEELGKMTIENTIKSLSQKAKQAFAERGLIDAKIALNKEHSSIFNLNIDEKSYKRLLDNNIVCLARGKGIRVGFHFYNIEEDLNRLLEILDRPV